MIKVVCMQFMNYICNLKSNKSFVRQLIFSNIIALTASNEDKT